MRDLSQIQNEHRNQLENEYPWIWLFSIRVPTVPYTRYRICNFTETVQFGTVQGAPAFYEPYLIIFDRVDSSTDGGVQSVTMTVGNITLEIIDVIESYDGLVGETVNLYLVNQEDLASDESSRSWSFEIRACTLVGGGAALQFSLESVGINQLAFPSRRTRRGHCLFRFAGQECQYLIPAGGAGNTVGTGFDFCPRTLDACEERGDDEAARGITQIHPYYFGGFPSIPRQSGGT